MLDRTAGAGDAARSVSSVSAVVFPPATSAERERGRRPTERAQVAKRTRRGERTPGAVSAPARCRRGWG